MCSMQSYNLTPQAEKEGTFDSSGLAPGGWLIYAVPLLREGLVNWTDGWINEQTSIWCTGRWMGGRWVEWQDSNMHFDRFKISSPIASVYYFRIFGSFLFKFEILVCGRLYFHLTDFTPRWSRKQYETETRQRAAHLQGPCHQVSASLTKCLFCCDSCGWFISFCLVVFLCFSCE